MLIFTVIYGAYEYRGRALGLGSGRHIGDVLLRLLDTAVLVAVIDTEVNDKDVALAHVPQHIIEGFIVPVFGISACLTKVIDRIFIRQHLIQLRTKAGYHYLIACQIIAVHILREIIGRRRISGYPYHRTAVLLGHLHKLYRGNAAGIASAAGIADRDIGRSSLNIYLFRRKIGLGCISVER